MLRYGISTTRTPPPVKIQTTQERLQASLVSEGSNFVHPALPGVSFTKEIVDRAASLAVAGVTDPENSEIATIVGFSYPPRHHHFSLAVETRDYPMQMALALTACLVSERLASLKTIGSPPESDLPQWAREDVFAALSIVKDFVSGAVASEPTSAICLMGYEDQSVKPFENAIRLIHNTRYGAVTLPLPFSSGELPSCSDILKNTFSGVVESTIYKYAALCRVQVAGSENELDASNSYLNTAVPLVYRSLVHYWLYVENPIFLVADIADLVVRWEKPIEVITAQLSKTDKSLVAGVVGEEFGDHTLLKFIHMHPGLREMRVRQVIASIWVEGNWKNDIERYQTSARSLGIMCALAEPTKEQKREALLNPLALSIAAGIPTSAEQIASAQSSREFICKFFNLKIDDFTAEHLDAFAIWVKGDQGELRRWWANFYPDAGTVARASTKLKCGEMLTAHEKLVCAEICDNDSFDAADASIVISYNDTLSEFSRTWFQASVTERKEYWRVGAKDLLAAASLHHKLRFTNVHLTKEETEVASLMLGHQLHEPDDENFEADIKTLKTAVVEKTTERTKNYLPEIFALGNDPQMNGMSLTAAAKRSDEFDMLLYLLDIAEKPTVTKDIHAILTRPKPRNASDLNEDDATSFRITLPDGKEILMDVICDGMGGQNAGSHSDGAINHSGERYLTNGERASRIAIDTIEIAALAGWIKGPEDVRRAILSADLAIVADQISLKRYDDSSQESDMATTVVVSLNVGNDFYSIHAGDSKSIVVNDSIHYETRPHNIKYEIYLSIKKDITPEVHVQHPAYNEEQLAQEVERRTVDKIKNIEGGIRVASNIVSSGLGIGIPYLHINNTERDYKPIRLPADALVITTSDGMDQLCVHEFSPLVNGLGITAARVEAIDLSTARTDKDAPVTPSCGCPAKTGKLDDATVIIRRARSFSAPDLSEFSNPTDFFSSDKFSRLIDRCLSFESTEYVASTLLSLMRSAGNAPPALRGEACKIAINTVCYVISERKDREDLVADIAPFTSSLGGIMRSALMEGHPTNQKRVMFDLLATNQKITTNTFPRDSAEFASLINSKSPSISNWVKQYFGMEVSPVTPPNYPNSFFGLMVSQNNKPLDPDETTYLDRFLLDRGNRVVQDTALVVGELPHDLEFAVLSLFLEDDISSEEKFLSIGNQNRKTIATVAGYIASPDGPKILEASFVIKLIELHGNSDLVSRATELVDVLNHHAPYYPLLKQALDRAKSSFE